MKQFFLTIVVVLLVALTTPVGAADNLEPASPYAVQISPRTAILQVRQTMPVLKDTTGQPFCHIVLPAGATDLHFAATAPVWRTDSEDVELVNTGNMGQLATKLKKRLSFIEGRLAAIKTCAALWENRPSSITYQDLSQQIQNVHQSLPELVQERIALEKEKETLKERLGKAEQASSIGQKITVWLDNTETDKNITLEYSYLLESCGWQALYHFEAHPGATRDADKIVVQLYAEVWQFSGIDWNETKISLVTQAIGTREPARLPRWTIEARELDQDASPRERLAVAPMPMVANEMATPSNAPIRKAQNKTVQIDEKALYARFDLPEGGMREGRSRVRIIADTWKAPFTWLARPVNGNTSVWLMADCILPQGKIWPTGKAMYYVGGQSAGEGFFRPEGTEIKLFFGADPRVSLVINNDIKKRAESGFIGKEKHWNWAWTYNLTNQHPQQVNVRIERPLPQIVNEKVTVQHDDTPEAKQDTQKHLLYWEISLPANGKAKIRHGIGINAPADMRILPVAP